MTEQVKWEELECFLRNVPNPILLEISSPGCAPCQELQRELDGKELPGEIARTSISLNSDNDNDFEIAVQLGVQSVPTVIGFCNGQEIDRVHSKKDIEPLVAKLQQCRIPRKK